MSFTFTSHPELPEIVIVEGKRFKDERGFFTESFRASEFEEHGIPPFVQENHSRSSPPCFRGLHYQLQPRAQGKLVYCVHGFIKDFVVDIRQGSPTFGKWIEIDLDCNNTKMVYIPPGYAHGFFAYGLHDAHIVYKVTDYYSPEHDRCIRGNDPAIGIPFCGDIKISDKDGSAPLLKDAENNFCYVGE